MYIKKELVNGCDKASRVYNNMFDVLMDIMQDSEKLRSLSPVDFSALGMYIGKFVEQEINSSVVQIMREFRGVEMPYYYCRRCRGKKVFVKTYDRSIYLNSYPKDCNDEDALQTLSLGDAYVALDILKAEDKWGFFDHYPWLYNEDFLEAWWRLSKLRNKMAHIGEIIDAETLEDNIEYFQTFLKYLPDMIEAKKELAPEGYKQSLKTTSKSKVGRSYYTSTDKKMERKKADYFLIRKVGACNIASSSRQKDESEPMSITKINPNAKIFKQRKGKRGLKDSWGNILVPPQYDNFGFLPKIEDDYKRKSVIGIRDDKYVLVTLDGSGKELTKDTYDDIRLADNTQRNSPYVYRKNGRRLWGLMDEEGHEICECMLDNYIGMRNLIWCDNGELRGCWLYTKPHLPFLPPIYDNIEASGIEGEPMIFTLRDVDGYVKTDGTFIPMSEIESMSEDQRQNALKECICE